MEWSKLPVFDKMRSLATCRDAAKILRLGFIPISSRPDLTSGSSSVVGEILSLVCRVAPGEFRGSL